MAEVGSKGPRSGMEKPGREVVVGSRDRVMTPYLVVCE